MASFVGSALLNGGSSFASNAVAGCASGDIAVIGLSDDQTTDCNVTTGWTAALDLQNGYGETSAYVGFWLKKLTSSDCSASISNTTSSTSGVLAVFRDTDVDTVMAAIADYFADSNKNTATPPSSSAITNGTFAADDISVIFALVQDSTDTISVPSGWTAPANSQDAGGSGSTSSVTVFAYRTGVTGTVTPGAFTGQSAGNFLDCIHLRLPASSGTTHDLTATHITGSAPTIDSPAIAQVHALTPTAITDGSPALDSPVIAQAQSLTATHLTGSAPLLDAPALAETHPLSADAITASAPLLDAATLAQVHALAATHITDGSPVLDQSVLTQVHALLATALTLSSPLLDSPALSQAQVLAATHITGSVPTLDMPVVITNAPDIQLIGTAHNEKQGTGTGTWSVDLSAIDIQEDDFIVLGLFTASTTTAPTVTDFTIAATDFGNDSNDCRATLLYRAVGATPPSSITIAEHIAGYAEIAIARVYRNVNLTTPFDVTTLTANGANTGQPTPPAITPVTDGAWTLAIGAGSSLAAFTNPGSEWDNFASYAYNASTFDAGGGFGTEAWSGGTVTPSTFTGGSTNANDSWAAITAALRPAYTSYSLAATAITNGAPAVDSPVLSQVHALLADELLGAIPILDAPVLTPIIALAATDILLGSPVLDTVAVFESHVLAATAITLGSPLLDAPALSQAQLLVGVEITAGAPLLDTPTALLTHALAPQLFTIGSPLLDQGTFAQTHVLLGNAITTGAPQLDTGLWVYGVPFERTFVAPADLLTAQRTFTVLPETLARHRTFTAPNDLLTTQRTFTARN